MTEPVAWLNGELLPISHATLHVFDAGLVHGDSVTELLRTFRHQLFRLDPHLDRFDHSLAVTGLSLPIDRRALAGILADVVSRNALLLPPGHDLGTIIFATAGLNATYVGSGVANSGGPTLCVHTFPLPFELWRDAFQRGLHLAVAGRLAIPPESLDPTAKTRSRIAWRIADREVRHTHPDALAILADEAGHLTETSSGNLFALLDGELRTPPADRVLPGISRAVVLELAQTLGIPARECAVSIDEARRADELWVSSTPYCLLPVTRWNGRPVATGTPGPLYRRFLDAWSDLVGLDIAGQMRTR